MPLGRFQPATNHGKRPIAGWVTVLAALSIAAYLADDSLADQLSVVPAEVQLDGLADGQQVVATLGAEDAVRDVTAEATYESSDETVVSVDADGRLIARGDGDAEVAVRFAGEAARIRVTVRGTASESPVSFENDVLPILTVHGCNAGACHGKQRGQNGFQLSLLGFDPDFDYAAIVQESRGRRVFPASPDESLLLAKPAARLPHGGGVRLEPEGSDYQTLRRWIVGGMPRAIENDRTLERIEIFPTERSLAPESRQQVVVTAVYDDGTRRDVTRLAAYQSNESAIADAGSTGIVETGPLPGEAAIMARFMGQIATCHVTIPHPDAVPAERYVELPRRNFIDELVWQKLAALRLLPSSEAAPHTLVRRLYLDIIGRLPTPDEVRSYLDDPSPERRARLIDELLARPEYADHWANKWVDLLRPNPYRVGIKAVFNYDAWIRAAFRENRPYDQFVRELITAQGSTWHNGATVLFRDRRAPDERATMVSQLFLGVRLECAKCHHHPFELWGQDDFYSFAAYFVGVGHKGTGLSPPISGSEEMIFSGARGTLPHPRTGEKLSPRPLFGDVEGNDSTDDPRAELARWITSPENHYFEQVMANRVWMELMGRGLVEPVDDLRATNPPSNPPLLEALGEHFRESDYDIKELIRAICDSYVYGLSSLAEGNNVADTRNHSRYYRQRLRAEVLMDAVADVTGVEHEFSAMPPGSRANQIWTHRIESLFLDTFGRPDANQDPPCERTADSSVVQALHLMNSPELQERITADDGRAARMAASEMSAEEIVEEVYLSVYSRFPSEEELLAATALFDGPETDRRRAVEDLMWALVNTPEFIFKN